MAHRMITRQGNTLVVTGAVTVDNVVDLTQQGLALLDGGRPLCVDLQRITEVDSTAISMLLEWLRAADDADRRLEFVHFTDNLESLMQLYGVKSLLMPEADS